MFRKIKEKEYEQFNEHVNEKLNEQITPLNKQVVRMFASRALFPGNNY